MESRRVMDASRQGPRRGTRGPEVGSNRLSSSFPPRGHSHRDREFRAPRRKSRTDAPSNPQTRPQVVSKRATPPIILETPQTLSPIGSNTTSSPEALLSWELLPPHEEVVEGCKVFWTSLIQVGFIPKRLFLERLSKDRSSISLFFILSILSVSARFTPSLIRRYGDCSSAGDYFIHHASRLVGQVLYEPTLENVQALFLLALAQYAQGDRTRSSMNMGIAVRMAGILRLHREETYVLPEHVSTDEAVQSEMARRTFWVLETQDHLHSGHASPLPFAPSDITALLPSDESDFAFGRVPKQRAALAGTKAAELNPQLTSLPSRSLFATLLEAHSHWGNVARKACRTDLSNDSVKPWDSGSDFARIIQTLNDWEAGLPDKHCWSVWNLRGYCAEELHLAYMSVVMATRLNHVVIRRIYLDDILAAASGTSQDDAPPSFWRNVAEDMFTNVCALHERIGTFISLRSENEGFPAMLLFSLYVCGTLAIQLLRWPHLAPRYASKAESIASGSLEILGDLQHIWPLASRWTNSLRRSAAYLQSRDGIDLPAFIPSTQFEDRIANSEDLQLPSIHSANSPRNIDTANLEVLSMAVSSRSQMEMMGSNEDLIDPSLTLTPTIRPLGDAFETELAEFLLGRTHMGMMNDWVSERFSVTQSF
ncbi:hypothetical protein BU16DRAFT_584600 [Lophium mytilinum]|uniref:Xylanolytic transcriptional activator regulatory domain-containing protein n=1 Tax=Lophium mytilinum TaxID=390894 RepID=A0A6A6QH10_9PEZI|nr:hypothetical protein BU16DRAFT_584600 [Lophium mytilinum]